MHKLVWSMTGDEISLVPCKPEVYSYFVAQLDAADANHYLTEQLDFSNDIEQLQFDVETVNNILTTRFRIQYLNFSNVNWLDQSVLNSVHRSWVKMHLEYPGIGMMCEKVEQGSQVRLNRINKLIHRIEEHFTKITLVSKSINFPNRFDHDVTMFGRSNLMINFNNLGRSTYNKWLNFDLDITDIDTNDYREFYTELSFNLSRPFTRSASPEYLEWAKQNNVKPTGETIGLANIDKLEQKLLSYREIVYRNTRLKNNFIELKE